MKSKLQEALVQIDKKNSEDPNQEALEGKPIPKELLYSRRITEKLLQFYPEASEALQIASRAQHICRWTIPRKDYPLGKIGYFKWRNALKKIHGQLAAEILTSIGYEEEFVHRVVFLINKKQIKKDSETQTLEDVVCLVFLEYYLDDFVTKHPEEKVIDILQKTWKKMSYQGQIYALKIKLSDHSSRIVSKALAN